jgi:N-acetylmuramoyl-L-alanine amidase
VPELTFNQKLASEVQATLIRDGFGSVILISGNSSLFDRVTRANNAQADVFLSLHHDSVQPRYLEKWRAENGREYLFSDRYSGYSLFVSFKNVFARESVLLATLIGTELMQQGLSFTRHHSEDIEGERRPLVDPIRGVYRHDDLVVLKNARAPAVLVEAGVIVNRAEELELASHKRQQLFASALSRALGMFCSATSRTSTR